MVTVTAAQLQKQFGKFRDLALTEPVVVTHHGRESLVVLSSEEYKRLKAMDERATMPVSDLPDDLSGELDATLERMKGVEAAPMKRHGPW